MLFQMKETGFAAETEYGELQIDNGGEHGFRPCELLTASIAVCSGGIMRAILDKKRISYEDLSIQAEVERNEVEANRITRIHLHFVVKAEQLTAAQMEKVMAWTFKNCSMVQSVKESIQIEETFEIVK
ncbi:OsmC family protein [Ectobacillus ponti]|uniref:OsmC family protein n=1 Tax=Ectobacillus ponti TaxID=2961894 RepID=A0AA42BT58_9BACI|nr:OsmC family protein [Ectobacillus ponti]MCP8971259.1 OsmC family protein [Ectobacillus ponti]